MASISANRQRVQRDIDLKRSLLNRKKKVKVKRVPKWQFPFASEKFYQKQLHNIVDLIQESLDRLLIPRLAILESELNNQRPEIKNDDFIDDLNGTVDDMDTFITDNQQDPDQLSSLIGSDVSVFNRSQMSKIFKSAFGVDVFSHEPWLNSQLGLFSQQNVDLIKNLSGKALHDIKGIVSRGLAAGTNLTDMRKDLQDRIGITRRRANLIARDQVSKLNGQLTQLRQTQNGISQYIWVTAGDERVRPSHAENEGQTFSWNDPPATGHPGDDYNCRCTALPVLADLL